MSRLQKLIMWVGVLAMVGLAAAPPRYFELRREGGMYRIPAGHQTWKRQSQPAPLYTDYGRFAMEVGSLLALTGVALITTRQQRAS